MTPESIADKLNNPRHRYVQQCKAVEVFQEFSRCHGVGLGSSPGVARVLNLNRDRWRVVDDEIDLSANSRRDVLRHETRRLNAASFQFECCGEAQHIFGEQMA